MSLTKTTVLTALILLAWPLSSAMAQDDQEQARRAARILEEELAGDPDMPLEERRALEERLRFLDGLARAKPMPMPTRPTESLPGTAPDEVVGYDIATGEIARRPAQSGVPSSTEHPGFLGTAPDGMDPVGWSAPYDPGADAARGCSTPSANCNTHAYPARTVTKLLMRYNVGGTNYFYVGSASTVASFHLLTAGHCIYSWDPDGDGNEADRRYAAEIWAWPAQTDLVNPFGPVVAGEPSEADYPWGVAKAVFLEAISTWTDSHDYNYDMGWITLDRRLGDRVGWMGAEFNTIAPTLNFNGYPAETPYVPAGVICQYPGIGVPTAYSSDRIDMCAYTYGGHSGGPVWRFNGTSHFIQGVNSTSDRQGYAEATRMTAIKHIQLYTQRIPMDEMQRPPTARPELIEYAFDDDDKDLLNNTVAQGDNIQIRYNVYNVGFASSGTVTIDFYLSTNQFISTGDRLIGTVTRSSMAPNTSTRPTTMLTVPCSTPTGTYYAGWIMRCSGTEYNEEGTADANNHVVIADETLQVTLGSPIVPFLEQPEPFETCVSTSPVLEWSATPRAEYYELQIGTSCGTGTIYTTTASSATVTQLAPGTTYAWRVRSINSCGASAWTSCRGFTTQPPNPVATTLVEPEAGACTAQLNVTLEWEAVPFAGSYELQLGGSCGSGSIVTTGATSYTFPSLSGGVHYWRVRPVSSCNGAHGPWTACRSFDVDVTPPAAPTVSSTSHTIGAWSNDNTVDMSWSGASDNCGILGYSYRWSAGAADLPDELPETSGTTSTSPTLTDGQSRYFHLHVLDNFGNVSDVVHVGPYWIDATPPTDPQTFVTDPEIDAWIDQDHIQVAWSGHADNLSGVDGFSVLFDQSSETLPDPVVDATPGNVAALEAPIGDGDHWFHLRTKDVAGNWTSTAHVGPFRIDQSAPDVTLTAPNGGEMIPCGEATTISWTATDAGSGVVSLELRYSTDGGVTYPELIAEPAPGTTSYEWTVPEISTEMLRVKLIATDAVSHVAEDASNADVAIECVVGIASSPEPVTRYVLGTSRPNPFRLSTEMRFAIVEGGAVKLMVLDVHGRRVRTLVDRALAGPARYDVLWDGTDDAGRRMGSGIYFYRLETRGFSKTRRIALLR